MTIKKTYKRLRDKLFIILLFVRYLPLFKCPYCNGSGGHMDYYGEWCECNPCEEPLREYIEYCDCYGKVSPYNWIKYKLTIRTGTAFPYCVSMLDVIKCLLGIHDYRLNSMIGATYCIRCFKPEEGTANDEL